MILKSVNNYNKMTINCDINYNKIPKGRGSTCLKSQNFKGRYMKLNWEFQVGGGSNQKICVCVCGGEEGMDILWNPTLYSKSCDYRYLI